MTAGTSASPGSTSPVRPDGRPPSVDEVARRLGETLPELAPPSCVGAARRAIADAMNRPQSRGQGAGDLASQIHELAVTEGRRALRRQLVPVINGTGVLLHTNLGRAPVAHQQQASYQNIELDLETGSRGSRQTTIGSLIAQACGAEAAMVVNNCSGALLLALAALGSGRGVSVSRGELVEIGGGFRVPDVMAQSGATLVEVGTTNRTRLGDYERAAAATDVALSLHVHRSNYTISGFTESTSVAELATLDAPVLADIGSGLLDTRCPWLDTPPPPWLQGEPAARQTLEAGASLVLFSGDKLLGGPQAGIIAGDAEMVAACGRHPLARALRPGGLVINALQSTILSYLRRDGDSIPFWRMASTTTEGLRARAQEIIAALPASSQESLTVVETDAVPGGGTLPGVTIPSVGLAIEGDVSTLLRAFEPPLVARVENETTLIDLRTIDPADDDIVIAALRTVPAP